LWARSALLSIFFFNLVACGGGGGGDEIIGTGDNPQTVEAAAYKGPFIIGSNVTVNILTESGQATDSTIITSTTDDLGSFSFDLNNPSLVLIKVDGYHFNEIRGVLSNGPITLNAIYDTNDSNRVFVNILTHLISSRVSRLIQTGSGSSVAIDQAQTELVNALSNIVSVNNIPDFSQLSVFNVDGTNSNGNAYLLALSAIVYQYADLEVGGDSSLLSGKLAETLNTLASDLADNGLVDNVGLLSGLVNTVGTINPNDVINNLTARSIAVNGTAIDVPDINLFIDTDGDGYVNSVDTDDDNDNILDVSDPNPYVPNNIPLANAGSDIPDVLVGMPVSLDGLLSSDADGQSLTYAWSQASGSPVTLINPTSATPSFVAPSVAGDIVFSLVVSDGFGSSAPSLVTVSIVGEYVLFSLNGSPSTLYNETVDNAYPSGYRTELTAVYNETKMTGPSGGVLRPAMTVRASHFEDNGSESILMINVFAQQTGTYVVDTEAQIRLYSMTGTVMNYNYRATDGSVTITEYDAVGNAVAGSFSVNAICTRSFPGCQPSNSISLSGSFKITREGDQVFTSVGSVATPVDLGSIPVGGYQPYVYDGANINMVSSSAPSYYQISTTTLSPTKISIENPTSSIVLTVYDSNLFDSPVCAANSESMTTVSCTATSTSGELYFSVALMDTNISGAWYEGVIGLASTVDEGTLLSPMDITNLSPYLGQADIVGSYYKLSVTPNTKHHITKQTLSGSSRMEVYDDALFTNSVCVMYYGDACTVDVGPTVNTLYIKIPPNSSFPAVDAYYYNLVHWEVDLPLYYLEVFPTSGAPYSTVCTNVFVYESDGITLVPGLHKISKACSVQSLDATVPLESGKTYYIRASDGLGSGTPTVDSYAIWMGTAPHAGTVTDVTPDQTLGEPENNTLNGAVNLTIDTLHYDSFDDSDSDSDMFVFTVP
jgi:hypothetical protein